MLHTRRQRWVSMSGHTTDDDAVAGSSVVHELDQQEVYLTVADGLERLVLNGTLKPGAKLPGERELCDQLGVSRPALREGLHILRERGLVYAMKGKGNFVSPANWEACGDPSLCSRTAASRV